MDSLAQRLILGVLAAVLVVVGFAAYQLHNLNELIVHRLQERTVQTLKTTVKNPAGDLVEVITEHNGNETAAEQYARHMVMVNIAKAGG